MTNIELLKISSILIDEATNAKDNGDLNECLNLIDAVKAIQRVIDNR